MKGTDSFLKSAALYVPTIIMLSLAFQEPIMLLPLLSLIPGWCFAKQLDS